MEVSCQLHAPATLAQGYSPKYPSNRRLDGPQSWSGRGGKGKKSQHCTCWELNPGHSTHSLVSILTELPQLPLKSNEKCNKSTHKWDVMILNHYELTNKPFQFVYRYWRQTLQTRRDKIKHSLVLFNEPLMSYFPGRGRTSLYPLYL